MTSRSVTTSRLLIVSPAAGGFDEETERRLQTALPGYRWLEFDPRKDFRRHLTATATVVVAGGDGTVGHVARALAGSRRRLGILPLGTYNNFAAGVGLPRRLSSALKVISAGTTRYVTLGRINDSAFLEVGAIGMFGDAMALGESAKEREWGTLGRELRAMAGAEPFAYTLSGDLEGEGEALSLVVANTPTTGAHMAIGGKQPSEPFLELSVQAGSSRIDVVSRLLRSATAQKHADETAMRFRFRSLRVTTKPRVRAFADATRAGRTPATITADVKALRVIHP